MHRGFKMVKDAIRLCPLPLNLLKEQSLIDYANSILPYDTGIEIECNSPANKLVFERECRKISNIKNIEFTDEFKCRIPSGIKGLICLWEVCELLKKHCTLNPQSGIHYHVDFTDIKNWYAFKYNILTDSNSYIWILNSLKSWNYKGRYNEWIVSNSKTAVRLHSGYNTIEFRIGEMTFDYPLIIKRIIHCQNISKKIKLMNKDLLKSPE